MAYNKNGWHAFFCSGPIKIGTIATFIFARLVVAVAEEMVHLYLSPDLQAQFGFADSYF